RACRGSGGKPPDQYREPEPDSACAGVDQNIMPDATGGATNRPRRPHMSWNRTSRTTVRLGPRASDDTTRGVKRISWRARILFYGAHETVWPSGCEQGWFVMPKRRNCR